MIARVGSGWDSTLAPVPGMRRPPSRRCATGAAGGAGGEGQMPSSRQTTLPCSVRNRSTWSPNRLSRCSRNPFPSLRAW